MLTPDLFVLPRIAGYRVDGHERELHAIRVPGEQTLHIIDVLRARCPRTATSTSATSKIASADSARRRPSPPTTSRAPSDSDGRRCPTSGGRWALRAEHDAGATSRVRSSSEMKRIYRTGRRAISWPEARWSRITRGENGQICRRSRNLPTGPATRRRGTAGVRRLGWGMRRERARHRAGPAHAG